VKQTKPISHYLIPLALVFLLLSGITAPDTAQAAPRQSPPGSTAFLGIPPYSGTAFIDPDITTPADPSTFISVTYTGRGDRTMYDRREVDWVTVNAYLFNAKYKDGLEIEVQINPEFGSVAAATTEAETYGWLVGQLPAALRRDVTMLWIHKGDEDFGGGNNSILIHTDRAAVYGDDLEEILIHEAAHTSLDADHAAAGGWITAQTVDDVFISTYAESNPTTEDVAESFLTWLAVRFKSDRISVATYDTITSTIPNRLAYFDSIYPDMYPLAPSLTHKSIGKFDGWVLESGENSGKGGSKNNLAGKIKVGDNAANKQFRGILAFNTGKLPDTAVVTFVTLKIKKAKIVGSDPFTSHGSLWVDIRNKFFGSLPALQTGDFQANPNAAAVGEVDPTPFAGWLTAKLDPSAYPFINKTGSTQFRLRFDLDDDNDNIADYLMFFSGNALKKLRPKLIIQYYIP